MHKITRVPHEPIPEYMQRLSRMGVRFIEGHDGGGAAAATPPWGSAEDFNPEKAWTLIQNLRAEVRETKSTADAVTADRDKYASQIEELQATVQLTDDTAKQLEGNLTKEQFGRKFDRLAFERNIPLNIASTIVAETEEDAIAKLDSLMEWRGAQETQERRPDPAQAAEPTTEPDPVKPGADRLRRAYGPE